MILLWMALACGGQPCHFEGDARAYQRLWERHYARPPCEAYILRLRGREAPEPPPERGPSVSGASFDVLEVQRSTLVGTGWEGIRAHAAQFEGSDLSRAVFRGALLHDVHIRESRLIETSFNGARMDRARLLDVELDRAGFRGASMRDAVIEATSAQEAVFRAADLTGARLTGLSGADLRGAVLRGAELGSCELPHAGPLEAVDLREGTLRVVDWSQLTLREVDLRGADLASCPSTGAPALCTGATLDEHTRLPPHLDAAAFCPGLPPPEPHQLVGDPRPPPQAERPADP